MLKIIHGYDLDHSVLVDGVAHPALATIEDEDGIRFLLSASRSIPTQVWSEVSSHDSAVGIYVPGIVSAVSHVHDDCECSIEGTVIEGSPWWYISSDKFMAHREQAGDDFILPDRFWRPFESVLSYRSIPRDEGPKLDTGFVHLHTHTEFSPLDGLSRVEELIDCAVADGQPALAVTDHGRCAAHPLLYEKATEAGIRPIFGIEAYLVNDRLERPNETPKKPSTTRLREDPSLLTVFEDDLAKHKANTQRISSEYFHLVLWAQHDEGLHNLWAMNTEANLSGFYRHPRMDWEVLRKHSEGVMASTACLRGPIAYWLMRDDEEQAQANLGKLMNIFGDRLYVELHTNKMEEQKLINQVMLSFANEHGLPTIAVSDSHYPTVNERLAHQTWIASQTNKELQDEKGLFDGDDAYHLMTEAEVRESLAYLGPQAVDEAVGNTLLVAQQCDAKVSGEPSAPIYSKQGGADRDAERLREICMAYWEEFLGDGRIAYTEEHPEEEYKARFEREMDLLVRKGFTGYFLQVSDYVLAAKNYYDPDAPPGRRRILVGPGRGSGSGSLVAYLCRITEIDPVAEDIIFERFLTEGRKALPDFDVDFPVWARDWIQEYVVQQYGEDHVARVGTIMRMRSKGTVQAMSRVFTGIEDMDYAHAKAVSDIIDSADSGLAGGHLSWDDLWEQHAEELDPYRKLYPKIFEAADTAVGRVNSYGRHPAGWIVSDQSLVDRWPLRRAGDQMVTEFDQDVLESLYLVKFDLLTIRNLDTVSMALDLIEDRFGIYLDPYKWREEYYDTYVWEQIAVGHTLGCFQIETKPMTDIVTELKPTSISELADAVTLVRPGPKRSGLTSLYMARKHGEDEVTYPDPRLEPSLSPTFGAMIYQEQVLAACMILAGYSSDEADKVRKLLGKKQVEKVDEAGKKFVSACVDRGMAEDRADWFWGQMATFAMYGFNKAHAWAYGIVAYWCAWLKVNYPLEYTTALLSTSDKDRQPDYVGEARRLGYKVLPPDINESGRGFRATDTLTIRYGLNMVKGVGVSADDIIDAQPYESWDDFMERAFDVKGNKVDAGTVGTLAAVGAFDSLVPNRFALESWLENRKTGLDTQCVHKDTRVSDAPNGLPCHFDWLNEPAPVSEKTGKTLKKKPIVKKCTKSCRNYSPPSALGPEELDVGSYTEVEIRQREREMLGSYLTSTPFDIISDEIMEEFTPLDKINRMRDGKYKAACVTRSLREVRDRNGKQMAFVTLDFPDGQGQLDCAVFHDDWSEYRKVLVSEHLMLCILKRNGTRTQLTYAEAVGVLA